MMRIIYCGWTGDAKVEGSLMVWGSEWGPPSDRRRAISDDLHLSISTFTTCTNTLLLSIELSLIQLCLISCSYRLLLQSLPLMNITMINSRYSAMIMDTKQFFRRPGCPPFSLNRHQPSLSIHRTYRPPNRKLLLAM
jgi:hypothetical protein